MFEPELDCGWLSLDGATELLLTVTFRISRTQDAILNNNFGTGKNSFPLEKTVTGPILVST